MPEGEPSRRPVVAAQRGWRRHCAALESLTLAERFEAIHDLNLWSAEGSRSGLGSEPDAAGAVAGRLPGLAAELGVRSLLDVPCGDGGWMAGVKLDGIDYTGVDVVPALIERSRARHAGDADRRFLLADARRDALPRADLVLCRDLLVHLSFENTARVLANVAASGSAWLLTTHFTDLTRNEEATDGDWRPLNLCLAPFGLPLPTTLLDEACDEADGAYADKTLALWPAAALAPPAA